MDGNGPFLWLSENGPARGFRKLPRAGMCLSAFAFIRQGERLLLGKYADDPRWEDLTGLDESRRRAHGRGWTIPATHLRFGEDPRAAGRRVADEVCGLAGLALSEPRVEVDVGPPARFPQADDHYDVWFFLDAEVRAPGAIAKPPWYRELAFVDAASLPKEAWGRSHEDVFERWLQLRARTL